MVITLKKCVFLVIFINGKYFTQKYNQLNSNALKYFIVTFFLLIKINFKALCSKVNKWHFLTKKNYKIKSKMKNGQLFLSISEISKKFYKKK